MRKSLAEIGYRSCTSTLTFEKARHFHKIASKIESLKEEEIQKTRKGRK